MEMEQRPPELAKKLWNVVRIIFFMLRKGISKSKVMMDFHLMLKRGNKIAEKAIGDLITFHHENNYSSAFTCRPDDAYLSSFISPREYEFSCSNSPAFSFPYYHNKKNYKHNYYLRQHRRHYGSGGNITSVNAVNKVLEMLNERVEREVAAASPMSLPGFGRSPAGVRQLRVTDSPFSLKDGGEDQETAAQLNKAAEEFIKKFYKDLNKQKKMALESPYHDMWLG